MTYYWKIAHKQTVVVLGRLGPAKQRQYEAIQR